MNFTESVVEVAGRAGGIDTLSHYEIGHNASGAAPRCCRPPYARSSEWEY